MKKYIENKKGYQILTPTGYKDFSGIAYMGDKEIFRVEFDNGWIECTELHKLFYNNGLEVCVKDLKTGDKLLSSTGDYVSVKAVFNTKRVEKVYDVIEVEGHTYWTNGVASHNCEFLNASDTLVDSMVLQNMQGMDPVREDVKVRWYDTIEPNGIYLFSLDPSLGVGKDYGAIQVFRLLKDEVIQVAEYQDNKTPIKGQLKVLYDLLTEFDNVMRDDPRQVGIPELYWTVENNTIGEAVVQIVNDTGEDYFPGYMMHEPKRSGLHIRYRKGLQTTLKTKLAACAKLKSLLERRIMTVRSKALISELKNFVQHGNTFAAASGPDIHDDLVSACLNICRMMIIMQGWDDAWTSKLKESLDLDEAGREPMPMKIMIGSNF